MSKLNSDWGFFCGLLESNGLKDPNTKLTAANFLVVVVKGSLDEEVTTIKDSQLLQGSKEIVICFDDGRFPDCGPVITELNCSKYHYILLSYNRNDGRSHWGNLFFSGLKKNRGRLIFQTIPQVLNLPWVLRDGGGRNRGRIRS